jgi:cysteinyl-tRNA synthetase
MEAISGKKPMAKYWMHGGFLTVNGQKMGKSLNNFIVLADLLKRCPANYLRFFIVKNLWRSPVDYSESVMIEVKSAVEKIEEFLRRMRSQKEKTGSKEISSCFKTFKNDFHNQLDDDFNTPQAFAAMFDFIKKTNQFLDTTSISKKQAGEIYKFFQEINSIFGIINFKKVNITIPAEIKKLAETRETHRENKEWQKADEVRLQIEKGGFTVEDTKDGPAIKRI